MKRHQHDKVLIAVLIIFLMILSTPVFAYAGENDVISEVREILRNEYVDPVSEEILKAPTIKEMLADLGDRNTVYMTKAEYNDFLGSLDRAFSGIGIELEMSAQGVFVTKVIPGYGAEKAGVMAGDIITEADGVSLAGKSSEFCVTKLRGLAGTKVQVKVKRASQTLSLAIERMVIELPLVESKILENHIGYIAVYSFGTNTVSQFAEHTRALMEQGVDSWILDLKNNGGGYTNAALELLGYFIGEQSALVVKDRSILSIVYRAKKQPFTFDQPVILLTNQYTGSSSEIVTAAIKDHYKATIIGETTFGSGRVKALIPLSNGDYLKMTIQRFFSPFDNPIDEVGIQPHMDLNGVDELQTAVMMLRTPDHDAASDHPSDKTGYFQLSAGPNNFAVSLAEIRKQENWKIGKKILDSGYVTTTMKMGGGNGWEHFPEVWLKDRSKFYYPGYIEAGKLSDIPLNKVFTITYTSAMDWNTVTAEGIELIDAGTGERIKTTFDFKDEVKMTVTPQSKLKADTEYWLVIHPTLKDSTGKVISGGVAVAKTIQ